MPAYRLAVKQRALLRTTFILDVPWPLPWPIELPQLDDDAWSRLAARFGLPEASGSTNVRALLDRHFVAWTETRKELKFRCNEEVVAHKTMAWLATAKHVGKPIEVEVNKHVENRLEEMSLLVLPSAPFKFSKGDVLQGSMLTPAVQLCALLCRKCAPKRRTLRPYTADFYLSLWSLWERDLGREVLLWASDGNGSEFVRFVVDFLEICGEPFSRGGSSKYERVRSRLEDLKRRHAAELELLRETSGPPPQRISFAGAWSEGLNVSVRQRKRDKAFVVTAGKQLRDVR